MIGRLSTMCLFALKTNKQNKFPMSKQNLGKSVDMLKIASWNLLCISRGHLIILSQRSLVTRKSNGFNFKVCEFFSERV